MTIGLLMASPFHLDRGQRVTVAMNDLPLSALATADLRGTQRHPLVFASHLLRIMLQWAGLFEASGYRTMAPGWPGVPDSVEAARPNPDSIANYGIEDVTGHYAAIIEGLPAKPILIGHSFRGMIAEKLPG